MASTRKEHLELTEGIGKCSVPMWINGVPADFCNQDAYGEQTKEYLNSFKYSNPEYDRPAYAPGLACPGHGGP